MYITPGPNNAMVLTSGLKFGFLRTIPHIFGITIGHIICGLAEREIFHKN